MCFWYLFSAKSAWQLVNRKANFLPNESIRITNRIVAWPRFARPNEYSIKLHREPEKNNILNFCLYLHQMLTISIFSTAGLNIKFATNSCLNIRPRLEHQFQVLVEPFCSVDTALLFTALLYCICVDN